MFQPALLQDDQVEPLAEGVLSILERIGILCQNQALLTALHAAGAQVDFAAERVRFPRPMVMEYVASFRRETAGQPARPEQFTPPALPTLELQVAQHYYDHESEGKRSGEAPLLTRLIKLGDALHREQGVAHCLLCRDVPPLLEPLHAALLLAEYAHRPRYVYAFNVRQTDYLREMESLLEGATFFTWIALCFAHPLRFDREVAARLARMAREGYTVGLTAMPVAGATTPVTVEGFITMSAAEHVATWITGRAVNPRVPLGGSMWAGTVDMRTGATSYSNFDAMYCAFTSIEFLRRWTGISIPPGSGEYCDSSRPGLYAALEKLYKAMTVAAFTGHHPGVGQGMLECGKTLSPEQLLIERDLATALGWYGRPLDPSAENIALPTMLEVDLGFQTSYMETRHTLEHFRRSLWLPELVDRAGWTGCDSEWTMLDRAHARTGELISQYVKPEGREDALAAMRQVVARASKDLLEGE